MRPVAPPSFMVFFDWDRSNLSQQALNTIKQAAAAFKSKGNARITATGHTDTSGPEAYNMALSLRRANAGKEAPVAEGAAEPPRRDRHPVGRITCERRAAIGPPFSCPDQTRWRCHDYDKSCR